VRSRVRLTPGPFKNPLNQGVFLLPHFGRLTRFCPILTHLDKKRVNRQVKNLTEDRRNPRSLICFKVPYISSCGYEHEPPSKNVQEHLLRKEANRAFYVPRYNADRFLAALAVRLDCYPPDYLTRLFSHLRQELSYLSSSFPLYLLPSPSPVVQEEVRGPCRSLYRTCIAPL
jgi:hypothetical protein